MRLVYTRVTECALSHVYTRDTFFLAISMPDMPFLSIVLPCYNEETNIAACVKDVARFVADAKLDAEIIVVNDGSKDRSLEVLRGLEKEIPNMRVVNHEKNGGYGIAVRSGCDAATGEWIAFMDSDLQFKAKDLSELLPYVDSFSFITGRRAHRADPPIRNAFGKILGIMNFVVLGLWVRDVNCGMKMFRKTVWPSIRPTYGVEKLFNAEMFLHLKQLGIPWKTVSVPHYPRVSGSPTGGSVRVIIRMFKELVGLRFSPSRATTHPLPVS